MATITFSLQGVTPTVIAETDKLQLAGASGFDSRIKVSEFNDTTHVKTSGGADKSAANTPNNVKFISQTGGTEGDSQADWGGGTEDLDAITDAEATLKVNFSDATEVSVEDAVFYSYDGTTPATAPIGMTIKAAEVGDTNFTDAEGSGSPLALADQTTPAESHDYFVVVSGSPDSVGLKSFAYRVELTYY
jgi:hypothetical protein